MRYALSLLLAATCTFANAFPAAISGQGTWETTLQGRDLDGDASTYEAYYDTALNITWLADANYADTSGYAENGSLNWEAANTWATNLNVNGVTGWRLPAMVDTGTPGCNWGFIGTDCGFNVSTTTSELAHLYYVTLGNKARYDIVGNDSQGEWGLTNNGPFKNLQSHFYWFGVKFSPFTQNSWYFGTNFGDQVHYGNGYKLMAWAVRPGDVAAVPEPAAFALMGIGVAALMLRRRLS